MYSVSKEMPLDSYQVITPSDNATNFTKGSIMRFTIPQSVGFFDSHMSKLQLLCRTDGANYKMCFNSQFAGSASCIDMIRVSAGGKVISEITEYSTLQHLVKSYTDSTSVRQRESLYSGVVDYSTGSSVLRRDASLNVCLGQGLNRSGADGAVAMEQDVKFQMELDMVGLFEVLEVVPMQLIGDVLLEVRLRQFDEEIMKVLPATAQTFTCVDVTTGATEIDILIDEFRGFTNLADSPFIKGMTVVTTTGTAEYEVTGLAFDETNGYIRLTIGTPIDAGDDGDTTFTITKGSDGNAAVADAKFIVSKAEILLQVVKPPMSYVEELMQQAEGDGLMIDLDSWTTYRNTVLSGVKAQTVTIPTTQSRAKSVLTVMRKQQTPAFAVDGSTDFDENGEFGDLYDYRTQINGIYYPNQPISSSILANQFHFPMEHVSELKKAFDACGLGIGNLERVGQNFVVGRALSKYGSSMNLTATPINLYLNYRSANGPLQMQANRTLAAGGPYDAISYVHHTTRLMISPGYIEIMN